MPRSTKNLLAAVIGDKEKEKEKGVQESNRGKMLRGQSRRGQGMRHVCERCGWAMYGGSGGRNRNHDQQGRRSRVGRGRGWGRGLELGLNASGRDQLKNTCTYENKYSGGRENLRNDHFVHGYGGKHGRGRGRREYHRSLKGKNVVSDHINAGDVASISKVSKDEEPKGKNTSKVVKGYVFVSKWMAKQQKSVPDKSEEDKKVELACSNVKGTSEAGDDRGRIENTSEEEENMLALGVCHEYCSPMINVCSFTIRSNSPKPCKIYGQIYSQDAKGDYWNLYKIGQDDAANISTNDTLSLNSLKGCPLTMDVPDIFMELKDKSSHADADADADADAAADDDGDDDGDGDGDGDGDDDDDDDDAWFVHEKLNLDTMIKGNNAEVKSQTFHVNNDTDVVVEYIAMPFADYVFVIVELSGHDVDDDNVGVEGFVQGDIVAYYVSPVGGRDTLLFRTRVESSERVTIVPSSRLCSFGVCVPSNRQLKIGVDLKFVIAGEAIDICDSEAFGPCRSDNNQKDFTKGNICIKVIADRDSPIHFFQLKMFDTTWDRQSAESRKCLQAFSRKQRMLRGLPLAICGGARLAVFSVLIVHDSDKPFSLFGTIKVSHYVGGDIFYDRRCIFTRDRTCPIVLDQCLKTLPLDDGLSFHSEGLTLWLNLKDDEGREFIRGVVDHPFCIPDHIYDIPLCSFIKGPIGYAAVHYVIFSNAVAATLKVVVVFKGSTTAVNTDVYGKLVARFGKYEYANKYQGQFYQIVLFDKPETEKELLTEYCSDLPEAFALPLSRSSVTVPTGEYIVIEVDLNVSAKGCATENLTCDRKFYIGSDGESEMIDGEHFQVRFSLEWTALAE